MTQGKLVKCSWIYDPVFIGNVFQQFYNMVDAVVVEICRNKKALAAVGSTGTIIFLIIGFLLGLIAGFTVLTVQKRWVRENGLRCVRPWKCTDPDSAGPAVMTAVSSMTGMHALLKFMHTPDDIFWRCICYVMIICEGFCPGIIYPGQYPPCTGKQ